MSGESSIIESGDSCTNVGEGGDIFDFVNSSDILFQLLPVTARQTIHLSLVSLKNSPKLKKELYKPALYDSRQKMGVLLRNEKKLDISNEWKSRENFTLKSCKNETQRGGRGRGGKNQRGTRSQGRQGQGRQGQKQSPKPVAKLTKAELKRQGRCFKCRQRGHLGKDCTAKDQANKGKN